MSEERCEVLAQAEGVTLRVHRCVRPASVTCICGDVQLGPEYARLVAHLNAQPRAVLLDDGAEQLLVVTPSVYANERAALTQAYVLALVERFEAEIALGLEDLTTGLDRLEARLGLMVKLMVPDEDRQALAGRVRDAMQTMTAAVEMFGARLRTLAPATGDAPVKRVLH